MPRATRGLGGMVVAPHHSASAAGLQILEAGGTAVEAAVATAAALAVVYPHMNSIGGDGFWLISQPGERPIGIDASGRAAGLATTQLYRRRGLDNVPWRGPLAANTVAGTISGWDMALRLAPGRGVRLPLRDLLAEAMRMARDGVVVTQGLAETLAAKSPELVGVAGFSEVFRPGGYAFRPGDVLKQTALAVTLGRLAEAGLDDFYRGGVAADLAIDLRAAGSPLNAADLAAHRPVKVTPLSARIGGATLFNLPSPTQGIASLLILSLFDRLGVSQADGFAHVHGLVEATKQAFRVRDRYVGDPERAAFDAQGLLDDEARLAVMGRAIDPARAAPWPQPSTTGDTVWLGVIDARGCAVSMIQSTYFEFGSGLVLPETGVTWQNRGSSFRLKGGGPNVLRPGAKPFHTLNPAMAAFDDGRLMTYGTMGGEGQPQTQAAIFSRYAHFGQDLQQAVTAPRWLLGRTWGETSTSLKLESRFALELIETLAAAGHAVEVVAPFTSVMGHAGALVRHPNGGLSGAADPRSDGAVATF